MVFLKILSYVLSIRHSCYFKSQSHIPLLHSWWQAMAVWGDGQGLPNISQTTLLFFLQYMFVYCHEADALQQ
jgi:hypothetical protein